MKMIPIVLSLFLGAMGWGQSVYKTQAHLDCDGYAQIQVGSADGACIGLVADQNLKDERIHQSFLFPRKMVELTPTRFLILDMGGWVQRKGALWELDLSQGQKKLWKLVAGLDRPHGLAWGPDGSLYVGEVHQIVRFSKDSLLKRKKPEMEVVIAGLKWSKGNSMHPLVNFTFGKSPQDLGDLYVNLGAPTDACVDEAPNKCSFDGERGVIRKYVYHAAINRWSSQFEVVASGLRNSMGLVSHESGLLLQVENSRDFQSPGEPFDELNVIQKGKHYGWPYCYNFQAISPEWREQFSCKSGFEPPLVLLPPHSAPLDLIYYKGNMFPELKGHLIMSLHGHKPTGSRILAYPTNDEGMPQIQNMNTWEFSSGSTKQSAKPTGGNLRTAPFVEIVMSWQKRDGVRPAGTPVGLLVASDGSIFIVEDKNKSILRISRTDRKNSSEENPEDLEKEKLLKVQIAVQKLKSQAQSLVAYNWINQNVFQSSCVACHSDVKGSATEAFEFMISEGWIEPGQDSSLLIQRLRGQNGFQKMPLGGSLTEDYIQYIEYFVKSL